MKEYFQQSLSRQFVSLMMRFLLFIIIGAVLILFASRLLFNFHAEINDRLEKKETLIQQIDNTFNQAFFDFRGYIAFENEELKRSGYAQEEKLRVLVSHYQQIAETPKDAIFLENVHEFLNYYYLEVIPKAMTNFEQGNREFVQNMANQGTTQRIKDFQEQMRSYRFEIDDQIELNYQLRAKQNGYIEITAAIFLLSIILLLFRMTRIMFTRVGQPLSEFATVANEIAAGKETNMKVAGDRKDELGTLSIAFQQMVITLQEKEQDLVAHNEELLAQQDELQAQQDQLETALIKLQRSENNLKRRNEFVKGISNSLDKQEVLDGIIINMCKVLSADRGIISYLHEDSYASFGISKTGVNQFIDHLENGLHERLINTKQSFFIKRELEDSEKGFHISKSHCYDLFLPILDSKGTVVAVLVMSRYGSPFTDNLEEYEGFIKQISISLEKIRLYEQSEEDRKRNQDIMNTVLEGIHLVDSGGKTVQINQKLCEMFDCEEWTKKMVGMPWDLWTTEMKQHVEEKDKFLKFVTDSIDTDENSDSFIYQTKNKKRVYKVYCKSLFHEEEKVGSVFVYRDITKDYEIDQMKSEFVSTVSHELRTPLASIYGYTELMLNRELKPERQQKYLNIIYQETKRLTSLINDFLDVQRMEAGKQTYEKKYIDVLPIIEKVLDLQKINTNHHAFEMKVETDFTIVLGDKEKLEQTFMNLINNGIKYSPAGGTVTIKIYQDRKQINVDIQDEGLGIPKEELDKLFSKFYRVDNSDRRQIGGTGLGLSIVKEIIEAHNGKVKVSSEYGKGSTFTLSFPVVERLTNPVAAEQILKEEDGFKVLVVEDDRSLIDLIEHELKENGFYVNTFTKATDAFQYLQEDVPDAIVLDIMLEDRMDGWMFMDELKKVEKYRHIPIIISTALDEKDRAFALGATDYLVKPYQPSNLSKTIIQTLLKKEKSGQVFIPYLNENNQ